MRYRLPFVVAILAIALLGVGGVLVTTAHPASASPDTKIASSSDGAFSSVDSSTFEPATCPAGCPVQVGTCTSTGQPCTCPDGKHGKCCVMGTSVSCVRNH